MRPRLPLGCVIAVVTVLAGAVPGVAGARVDLSLGSVSSPLEGLLVRDQVRMYLAELEKTHGIPAGGRYRCTLGVRHRQGRMFDYTLELHEGERLIGRQSGAYSFEEFRSGFGKAFETVLTAPPEVRVVSLDELKSAVGEPAERRRALIECLEATERVVVLESADFAHHRLEVTLERARDGAETARLSLDGEALPPVSLEQGELWRPALAVVSLLAGRQLERVRLALFEYVEAPGKPRPLRRGPMDYRLGSEDWVRQAVLDGEGYPVLVERGARLTIQRFGYLPRTIRLRDEPAGLKQVYLIARGAPVTFRTLTPGHRTGPMRLLGYDGEDLLVEDGVPVVLKRDYKYRYAMDVWQRGVWQVVSGWFVVPPDGPVELADEQFPNNLELTAAPETPAPAAVAEDQE
jgi:hypothetical protein